MQSALEKDMNHSRLKNRNLTLWMILPKSGMMVVYKSICALVFAHVMKLSNQILNQRWMQRDINSMNHLNNLEFQAHLNFLLIKQSLWEVIDHHFSGNLMLQPMFLCTGLNQVIRFLTTSKIATQKIWKIM